MTPTAAVAAACATVVALGSGPAALARLATPTTTRQARRTLPPRLATAAAALAAYALAGPRLGLPAAVAVAVATHRLVAALPSRAAAERDRRRAAAVPLLADLVAACVTAGATTDAAVDAAATAMPGPLADDLRTAVGAVRLGVPPPVAYAPLVAPGTPPPVRALGRALLRSAESGAAPAAILRNVADDARATARTAGEVAARRAAVVAVLPLGLCFLPAFVLLGIVPLVASLLRTVTG
jgi:Flp pilus assembly protein TadB